MNHFDNLNPFLVRQEQAVNDSTINTTEPSTNRHTDKLTIESTNSSTSHTNTSTPPTTSGTATPPLTPPPVIDQTYIENILRINIGKSGRFYFSFNNSSQWRDRMYRGVIEQAGRDHFVIHDPTNGVRYLLPLSCLDWVEFDERINYQVPYV